MSVKHFSRWTATTVVLLCAMIVASTHAASAGQDRQSVTFDAKIGQMLMVGFRGLAVDECGPVARDIREGRVGGIILFDYDVPSRTPLRNIASPTQVKSLVADLQREAEIPLLVAIDQEGGRVSRLKEKFGFPPSVSQAYLGERNTPDATRRFAGITADTLADLGINVNFAPVVDLNINPDNPVIGGLGRSFSPDPAIVVTHALIVINTFHEKGILSAIKHFPGHGSSQADSHRGFVDVTGSWSPIELLPFRRIVDEGVCDMVMTAHIFNERLDPVWPATLSDRIITGLLRNDIGFRGVVVSDDMQMGAIRSCYSLETAVRRAILAGCDILVFANNSVYEEDIASRAHGLIREMVVRGTVSEDRIDQSYGRILRLKRGLPKTQ